MNVTKASMTAVLVAAALLALIAVPEGCSSKSSGLSSAPSCDAYYAHLMAACPQVPRVVGQKWCGLDCEEASRKAGSACTNELNAFLSCYIAAPVTCGSDGCPHDQTGCGSQDTALAGCERLAPFLDSGSRSGGSSGAGSSGGSSGVSSSGGSSGSGSGSGGSSGSGSGSSSGSGSGGPVYTGSDKCWYVGGPQGTGSDCVPGSTLCAGGYGGFDGYGARAIRCPDGHTYTAGCGVSGSQCTCSCSIDSAVSGTPCSQPTYTCLAAAPAPNAACTTATSTPTGCGFPALVGQATAAKSCCSDAECPPFLPNCSYGTCTDAAHGSGGYTCPVDAGASDTGPSAPSCKVDADCGKPDLLCQNYSCLRLACKDATGCPSGFTCPSSGFCTK